MSHRGRVDLRRDQHGADAHARLRSSSRGQRGRRCGMSLATRCARRSSRTRDASSTAGIPAIPARRPSGRAALFDFIYQTYDSSAWIPQSLFDSNLMTQAVVGDVDTIVGKKVGLVLWRGADGRACLRHGAGTAV